MDRTDPQVQELAARRYRERTFELGPRYGRGGVRRYRPGFETLPPDNWLRGRHEDEAIAELEAEAASP